MWIVTSPFIIDHNSRFSDYSFHSFSLLHAITRDGIIFSDVKVDGYNGEEFPDFLDRLIERMNLWPQLRSVLVIDNCWIHHVEVVEAPCEAKEGFLTSYLLDNTELSSVGVLGSSIYPLTCQTTIQLKNASD